MPDYHEGSFLEGFKARMLGRPDSGCPDAAANVYKSLSWLAGWRKADKETAMPVQKDWHLLAVKSKKALQKEGAS